MRRQQEILELVGTCAERIEEVSGRDFSYAYDLNYSWMNDPKTMTAGYCEYVSDRSTTFLTLGDSSLTRTLKTYKSAEITLNPFVLNDDAKLKRTLTHEMLHAFCAIEYNCTGHGGEWKKLAKKLEFTRCHSYEVPEEYLKTHRWAMNCPV